VQAFNYGTIFHVGDRGVLIFDTLEGVYDNVVQAVGSVTDKPITAAIYPHYHADHIGDIDKYVAAAAAKAGQSLRIIGSEKSRQAMELSSSAFPHITDVVDWPRGSFQFEDVTVELHGFEWAAHTEGHAAWLLPEDPSSEVRQPLRLRGGRGTVAIPGASRADAMIRLPANAFMQSCKTIMGVVEGDSVPDVVVPQLLDLHMQGRFPFDRLVRFNDFDQINQAAADTASGATIKPIIRIS
jgi:ribonuclease BN (tRNA processing enzyme)